MSVAVTNADRVVFASGHTKGDVVAWYGRAASLALVHVAGRPLTLRRYPKGVGQPGFFQKNVPSHYPASIDRVEVPRKDGVTVHPCVHTAEHLEFLANQGVIELHIPLVSASNLEHPDRFVIDLDPPQGEVALVRRAALVIRDELAELGLETSPVATGSKGYHVVARLEPVVGFWPMAVAGQQVGALMAHRYPDLFTTTFRVAQRGKRVFVDWMRNNPSATVVAPWSLRARKEPSVAVPIRWQELESIAPDGCVLGHVAEERLAIGDPLADNEPVDATGFVENVARAVTDAKLQ